MMDVLKALLKQPYWVIALVLGVVLVALPCVTIDKDNHLATHPPNTFSLVAFGGALLLLSAVGFALKRDVDILPRPIKLLSGEPWRSWEGQRMMALDRYE